MEERSWMMGDDEREGANKVFKQPSKMQRHSNVGLANFMGPEPNLNQCSKVVHSSIELSMPTYAGKEDLPRPQGHQLRARSQR